MAERILIIVDHQETARLVEDALAAERFEVLVARTGERGLALLGEIAVDAIVVDSLLPLMTGMQLVETLHASGATVPIMLLTACDASDVVAAATRTGIFGCVQKNRNYLPALVNGLRAALASRSLQADGARVVRSVFVGREEELGVLGDAMTAAVAGRGRLAFVVGESGIGKSALARAAAKLAATNGLLPLWGRCREGADAYAVWREIHHGHRRWRSGAGDAGADGAAAYVAHLVPRLEAEIPATWDAPPPESDAARLQRYGKVVHYCRLVSSRQPMLLLLEDVHLIDSASLRFLAYLAEQLWDTHLMVLGMFRPGDHEAVRTLEKVARDSDAQMIGLRPLSRRDVALYVERATDRKPSESVVDALYEKAEGHPLFTVDLVRLLVARGRLLDPMTAAFWDTLPPSELHAVDLRLQFVPEPHRRILAVAALIGREFETDVLRAAIGDLASRLEATCEEAVAHGLLSEADGPDALRFAHELVREELARRLPRTERLAAHLRIATALERKYGASSPPYLSRVARHLLEGGDLEQGIRYAIRAADRQAMLQAYPEAARLYEAALQADARTQLCIGERAAVLARLAEVYWRAGEFQHARAVGREAFELAKRADDDELLTTAVLAFAGQLPGYGAVASDDAVIAGLEHTLATVPARKSALHVQLLSRLVEELTFSPREVDRRAYIERMRRLARRQADPKVEASALRRGQWTGSSEEPANRARLAEHMVALAGRANDPVLRLEGDFLYLWSALEAGRPDAVREHLRSCAETAASLRVPYYTWLLGVARACVALVAGRLDAAWEHAESARHPGLACGNPNAGLFFAAQAGHLRWLRGDVDGVLQLLESMEQQFPVLTVPVHCARAATLADAGRLDTSRTDLEAFVADRFARLPRNVTWLTAVAYLAEATSRLGARDAARMLHDALSPFEPFVVLLPPLFSHGPVTHHLGTLAAAMDRCDEAEKHLRRALAIEERMGTRQWVARTALELARVLAPNRERRAEAAALLDRVDALAGDLSLRIVAERCAAVRAELPSAPRAPVAPPRPRRCVIRETGKYCEVALDDEPPVRMRRHNGERHIVELIRHPGHAISVFVLNGLARGVPMLVERRGGSMVDGTARLEGQRTTSERLAEVKRLKAAEEDLESDGCHDEALAARAKRESIEDEIEETLGWLREGRGPELAGQADNVRTNVKHAIEDAIDRFTACVAELGAHLRTNVATGWDCIYYPDALWVVEVC